MYRVVNWEKLYENNRSRDILELDWVPFKNRHDGDGITELLDHDNGMAHLGAWVLLVQVASKCGKPAGKCGPGEIPRGTLWRDIGEPHTIRSIARVSGGKLEVFEEAIPRLLKIKWLEVIPDPIMTYEIPQEGAVSPQAPTEIPQAGDDRARGRVPFSSLPFPSEGGPGETTPAAAGQPDYNRAREVAALYPAKAPKDGRPISFPLTAQNMLAVRIAKAPDYPWEEHARLCGTIPTPQDGLKWVEDMPNPVTLAKLRQAVTPGPERRKL
jgi:hypothetical protein